MKKYVLLLALPMLTACLSQSGPDGIEDWRVEARSPEAPAQSVLEYDVEFLPMLPTIPGTVIVGKLYIDNEAKLDYMNEELMLAIKRMAASIGGNTVIYAYPGVDEAPVAYVPQEEQNLHGGDEIPWDYLP